MRNASGHQGENEWQRKKGNRNTYNISPIKRVTRKFLAEFNVVVVQKNGKTWTCCCFFCVTWAEFMAILRVVVCSVLFSDIKRSKAGDCVQSQLTNPPPHQGSAHLITMKAPNPFRPSECLISSPSPEYCDAFFVGNFFESFWFWAIWRALRKLDDYVLRDEREGGWDEASFAFHNPTVPWA